MKCSNCGKDIHNLIIKYQDDDKNGDEIVRIREKYGHLDFFLEDITKYGWDEIENTGIENRVCCPECGKYPLNNMKKIYNYAVDVVKVVFREKENEE